MTFEVPRFEDIPEIRMLLAADPREQSEYALSYQFPFVEAPRTQAHLAHSHGCAVWRWLFDGGFRFFFPFGPGDKRRALLDVQDFCRGEGVPLVMTSMSEADLALFRETLGGDFDVKTFEEESDYVYNTRDLADLPGRAYQSRRTFVNHFTKAAPWSYEPVSTDNRADCHRVLDGWQRAKFASGKDLDETQREEVEGTRFVLDHLPTLGLRGGLLRQAGEPVAFGLADRLTADMMLLAYEKALPCVHGAFQTGDREFARACADGCAFINRAYDEGCPGLRKVKQLYHPVRMVEKFIARAR